MTVLPIHRVPVLTCVFIPVGSEWRRGCLRRRSGRVPEVSREVPGRSGIFPGGSGRVSGIFPEGSGTGAVSFRFDRFRPFLTDSDRIWHGFGRFRTVSDGFRPFQIPPENGFRPFQIPPETVSDRFRFRRKRFQTVALGLPTHAVWLPQVPSVPHACVIRR